MAEDLRAAKAFHVVRDAVKALSGKEEMELGIIEQYVAAKDLPQVAALFGSPFGFMTAA